MNVFVAHCGGSSTTQLVGLALPGCMPTDSEVADQSKLAKRSLAVCAKLLTAVVLVGARC
jgi:hypothetical protein